MDIIVGNAVPSMNSKRKNWISSRPLGPPPPPSSEVVSKVMKANIARDTTPELVMRRALRNVGLPGYRLNWKGAPGRPDIAYPGRRIAIFIHGCFWHRCPRCKPTLPKTHTDFWRRKFERNKERDRIKIEALKRLGWEVFVFWECEIRADASRCAAKVSDYVKS